MRHVEMQLVKKYDQVIKTLQETMETGLNFTNKTLFYVFISMYTRIFLYVIMYVFLYLCVMFCLERRVNKQKTDLLEEHIANITRQLQTLVQRSVDFPPTQGKKFIFGNKLGSVLKFNGCHFVIRGFFKIKSCQPASLPAWQNT